MGHRQRAGARAPTTTVSSVSGKAGRQGPCTARCCAVSPPQVFHGSAPPRAPPHPKHAQQRAGIPGGRRGTYWSTETCHPVSSWVCGTRWTSARRGSAGCHESCVSGDDRGDRAAKTQTGKSTKALGRTDFPFDWLVGRVVDPVGGRVVRRAPFLEGARIALCGGRSRRETCVNTRAPAGAAAFGLPGQRGFIIVKRTFSLIVSAQYLTPGRPETGFLWRV